MHGHSKGRRRRLSRPRVAHRERPLCEITQLGRAVHQVVKIGCGEDKRMIGLKKLRRHPPAQRRRRLELDADRALLQARHPHQRGRHIDMRMARIDSQVRPVDTVSENSVPHAQSPIVTRHYPLVRRRPLHRERAADPVEHLDGKHVLGEFVPGVAAG